MIAYNKTTIENIALLKKAKQWYAQQLLSTDQFAEITKAYPVDFYRPNLFMKIGLFIFTCISIGAAVGLFCLFFLQAFNNNSSGFAFGTCLFFAASCIMVMESLIKKRKIYWSGVDEALLYNALFFMIGGLVFIMNGLFKDANTTLVFAVAMLPIFSVAAVRYADRLSAFCLAICCYAVFFLLLLKLGAVAKMIMPFALMFLSVFIYLAIKKIQDKPNLVYWKPVLTIVECTALAVFYLSGNYFVVRECSVQFFDLVIGQGRDIPLAIVFYFFTALVPIVYIFYGLKQKDKTLLWMGLVLVAAAALTFKNYFSLGHPEILLTVSGIVAIGIAYAAIRHFKIPKHGITFEEDADEDSFLKTNAEALLLAQSFGLDHNADPPNTTQFGGGTGGGGGATGDW